MHPSSKAPPPRSVIPGAHRQPLIVRVNTGSGICGFGKTGVAYTAGGDGASGLLRDLAKFILGMDSMNSEAVWNTLHRQTFWGMGGGPIVFAAISTIDIALWDIRGKALGVPAYQLLGGKTNSKLRSYASQIQFGWGPVGTAMVDPRTMPRPPARRWPRAIPA